MSEQDPTIDAEFTAIIAAEFDQSDYESVAETAEEYMSSAEHEYQVFIDELYGMISMYLSPDTKTEYTAQEREMHLDAHLLALQMLIKDIAESSVVLDENGYINTDLTIDRAVDKISYLVNDAMAYREGAYTQIGQDIDSGTYVEDEDLREVVPYRGDGTQILNVQGAVEYLHQDMTDFMDGVLGRPQE